LLLATALTKDGAGYRRRARREGPRPEWQGIVRSR